MAKKPSKLKHSVNDIPIDLALQCSARVEAALAPAIHPKIATLRKYLGLQALTIMPNSGKHVECTCGPQINNNMSHICMFWNRRPDSLCKYFSCFSMLTHMHLCIQHCSIVGISEKR